MIDVRLAVALLSRARELAHSRATALLPNSPRAVQLELADDDLSELAIHNDEVTDARDGLLAFAESLPEIDGPGVVTVTVSLGGAAGRAAVVGVLRSLLDEDCAKWTAALQQTVDVCIVGGRPADRRAGWAAVSSAATSVEVLTSTITRLTLPSDALDPLR